MKLERKKKVSKLYREQQQLKLIICYFHSKLSIIEQRIFITSLRSRKETSFPIPISKIKKLRPDELIYSVIKHFSLPFSKPQEKGRMGKSES